MITADLSNWLVCICFFVFVAVIPCLTWNFPYMGRENCLLGVTGCSCRFVHPTAQHIASR